MGVEVSHYQYLLFRLKILFGNDGCYFPRQSRCVRCSDADTYRLPPKVDKHERTTGSLANLLIIFTFAMVFIHRDCLPLLSQQLNQLFVHTNHQFLFAIRLRYTSRTSSIAATKAAFYFGGIHRHFFKCGLYGFSLISFRPREPIYVQQCPVLLPYSPEAAGYTGCNL